MTISATPDNPHDWEWPSGGIAVDEKGWIWIASYIRRPPHPTESSAIYTIPPRGTNKLGNPIYDWNDAVRVVSDTAGPDALGISKGDNFQWKLAGRSIDDGMIYGLANTKKAGAPQDEKAAYGWQCASGIAREGCPKP
jgi:hypothetical protein